MKMQTFRKPHQWLNFWLEKYAETLSVLKYNGEQRKRLWTTLKLFLETLPGNPRKIPLDSVRSFIDADPAGRLLPIAIFYKHIAPSKPHVEMLEKIESAHSTDSPIENNDPVEKFRAILTDHNFSQQTIRNYCTVLTAYLAWLGGDFGCTSIEKINEYCAYLADEKGLAPRTVALHCAALKKFHKKVMHPERTQPEA